MGKKKNKQIIRPWCWYCEREFEDEKVLMQHQKAKHFKCSMCPRRLNTAGGLAVHIQQVHKLEPENLPRIENALSGRDGYEVEIFGMVGIPAPDVADYKRRKEIELGLSAGSISQPPQKRPKIENKPLSEDDLAAQLAAHKALMGLTTGPEPGPSSGIPDANAGAVFGAPPQSYAAPPTPSMPPHGSMPPMPPPGMFASPPPPGAFPGGMPPPFPPFMPGMPPGPPPPGMGLPPGFPPGMPPMMPPPGISPPPGLHAPNFIPAGTSPVPPFAPPGAFPPGPPLNVQAPAQSQLPPFPPQPPAQVKADTPAPLRPQLVLPNPALSQENPAFKKATSLKWSDPNFSPEEHRAIHPRYLVDKENLGADSASDEPRGKKRKKAEDFL